MTRRFTETAKWDDPWYRRLAPAAKLVYSYLCDKCDCAGFWEVDWEAVAFQTGLRRGDAGESETHAAWTIEGAMEEIEHADSEKILYSGDGSWLFVINFLHRQGNWPLKTATNVTAGIRKCFAVQGDFGQKAWKALEKKYPETSTGGLVSPCGTVDEGLVKSSPRIEQGSTKPSARVDEVLAKSPGKGNGTGKGEGKGPEGGPGGDAPAAVAGGRSIAEQIGDLIETGSPSVADGTEAVFKAWNAFAKKPAREADLLRIGTAYSALVLGPADRRATHDEIMASLDNYRDACHLPNSQAWAYPLPIFLTWDKIQKFLPGLYNQDNFDASKFGRLPEAAHECQKRRTLGCPQPGIHKHTDDTGAEYWLCNNHEQERRRLLAAKGKA
jgi:hypothetical protein